MILVNLLPHREERRKRRKVAYFVCLALAAVAGLVLVGIWYLALQEMTSGQQQRNEFLRGEVAKLDSKIKDIATLRAEIDSLKARQKAVEDLQIDRNVPVEVLNELVRQTPEGIYFRTVRQDGQVLNLVGVAQTNERVSEFLRNTAYKSEWLVKPELVEIKASTVQTASHEQQRLFEFSMRLTIKRPQDQAAEAASGAASGGALAKKV